MKKRISIILVAMLMISIIPNFAFAANMQDEAEQLKKVFAKLTDDDKSVLSKAKSDIHDLSQDEDHDVWIGEDGVFDLLPVDSDPFIKEFGNKDKAEEFVRDFISEFTTTIYFTGDNNDLAGELEDFYDKYEERFIGIFGSEGKDLLRELNTLMFDALANPGQYIDSEDANTLAGANTNRALVDGIKEILKQIITDKALDDDIQNQLKEVNWEAGNIVEAGFLLIKEVDNESYRASLALANAVLRSEGKVTSGDTTPKVGVSTHYKISFFGIQTGLFKFMLDDSTKGKFENDTNPFVPSQTGKAKVYVFRTTVNPEDEPWNYIYDFDITISKKSSSGGGGGGGGSDPDTTDTSDSEAEVGSDSIDTTVKQENGQDVAEVKVDNDAIKDIVEQGEKGTTIVVKVDADADVVQAGFDGDMISLMEKNDISISIKTETASYSVPAKDIDISALAKELGVDVDVSDVTLSIVIAEPTAEVIKVIEDQAVKSGVQLVIPPIEFDVVCTNGENSVTVNKFSSFVERSIIVPEGVDPKAITTAVVQDEEGNLTPVPTVVVKIDGEYYVKIKSMTNSVYTVINNNKQFADVASHWAKDDVNDMGSRLIINGVSDTTFEPDRDITRAEFMTIVVKALGIMRSGEGLDAFDDVNSDDWYYDAVSIAKDYGLTNGNGNGTFTPNSKITREEAMTIIARAMKMAGMDTSVTASEISKALGAFVDNGYISGWAKESVATCVKNGIVSGYDGKISAKNNITRAECAAIVKRMLVKADLID